MRYNARNIPLYINNQRLLINEAEISQSVDLDSPYTYQDRVSTSYIPKSPYIGKLNIKYYLTGVDFLKKYIYSLESDRISGNFCGITFNQGYLTSYSLPCLPNKSVEVSAEISFYDKISGAFSPTAPVAFGGSVLNFGNVSINNLSDYTISPLNNILEARFSYNSNIEPVYKYSDTGSSPISADRINIGERVINSEIVSDSISMDIPLSGEDFGLILNLNNIDGISSETFGCSGKINFKSLSIGANSEHTHTISISQKHLSLVGGISGVSIAGNNTITIKSNLNTYPFKSQDRTLNYVDKINIGEVECTGYIITGYSTHDEIIIPENLNISDDYLTIYSSRGNFFWPNKLQFNYAPIVISSLSITSGRAGSPMIIDGSNFNYISDVFIGQTRSNFYTTSGTRIFTTVPYNGITDKVRVVSSRRGISGISSQTFFHEPRITVHSPLTGQWTDPIIIGGTNFSGTVSLKFNIANASGYSVLSNSIISANAPQTGAGYAGGYIYLETSGGSSRSPSQYLPNVITYGFTPTSGVAGDNITIRAKTDPLYFCPTGDGFKVSFGGGDAKFYINSTGSLTGMVPSGASDGYIYLYRPDGISVYNPNTGTFNVLGDPEIYSVSGGWVGPGPQINVYFPLTIIGKNLHYFNRSTSFIALSGAGSPYGPSFATHSVSKVTGNRIISSSDGTMAYIPAMIYSGNIEISEYLSLVIKNDYGTTVRDVVAGTYGPTNLAGPLVLQGDGTFTQFATVTPQGYAYVAGTPNIYWLRDGSFFTPVAMLAYYSGVGNLDFRRQSIIDFYRTDGAPMNISSFLFIGYPDYSEWAGVIVPRYGYTSQTTNPGIATTNFYTGVVSLFRGSQEVYNSSAISIGKADELLVNPSDGAYYLSGRRHILPDIYTGITKIRLSTTGFAGNGVSTAIPPYVLNLLEFKIF